MPTHFRGSRGAAAPVAIIGAGLGGLSAAIHLRLAGRDVRVYEANAAPGGRASRITQEGYTFDTGPSLLNYPWVFERLFAAAGRDMADYVTLTPVDPSVAFRWPDGTALQLSSDYPRLLEAFSRLEPGCGPGLAAFFQDARAKYDLSFDKLVTRNADSPWAWLGALRLREAAKLSLWRTLYGELGRFFHSRHIREALGSYGMYLGGSPFDLPGIFSILAYGELAHGLWLPKGGVYGLVEGMTQLARELGVDFVFGERVQGIAVKDGAVAGVRRADGTLDPWPVVVSNVDTPTTDTVLVEDAAFRAAGAERAEKLRMTPSVLTFYWGVEGGPGALGHHTIFLPNDYRGAFEDLFHGDGPPRGLPFYASVASETDPDLAPRGCHGMFVLVPLPVLPAMGNGEPACPVEVIRETVLERLAAEGAPIEPSRIATETVWTPRDWRDRFGLYRGSAFGAAHTLFQMGPWRTPNHARALPGLYYVGAGTTPGTGMPMTVLSGMMTAERVVSHAC